MKEIKQNPKTDSISAEDNQTEEGHTLQRVSLKRRPGTTRTGGPRKTHTGLRQVGTRRDSENVPWDTPVE